MPIPYWKLKQIFVPAGRRQGAARKRPVGVWPPRYKDTRLLLGSGEFEGRAPASAVGNLSNEEYRFWVGNKFGCANEAATCRCCGRYLWSGEARKRHMELFGCTKSLVLAYNLLIAGRLCVACDKPTTTKKWGVPLCKGACEESWKFDGHVDAMWKKNVRRALDVLYARSEIPRPGV